MDGAIFSNRFNKFESDDQRAEAKIKIALITAQQRKFEERKKALEEELKRRKEEEDEMERLLQEQIDQEKRLEEERIREDKERREKQEIEPQETQETKKVKKVKKKKKSAALPITPMAEELPQLKLGFLDFSDNKSKFEKLRQDSEASPEVKLVKVNKLKINQFLNNINNEEKNDQKVTQVKVSKLKKNSFMEQLEKAAADNQEHLHKKKNSDLQKKSQPEIKFTSKKSSMDSSKEEKADREMPKPKVRGSKSIENPSQNKDRKHSSTFSLFIDNTKEFFRNSKEKLYKLSKEALNEIDEIKKEEEHTKKMSTSEMQNYLLSHVLFDKPEIKDQKKKEKQLTKEEEMDIYLDKEYREKIEQYCSLVEESKPKKKRSKTKKPEEKLPEIKMVEVKSIQEQLKHKLEKPPEKKLIIEELENLGTSRVKQMRENLRPESSVIDGNEFKAVKPKKMNSSILNKIKSLEKVEEERLHREKENEERIRKLLENEMIRQSKRAEKIIDSQNIEDSYEEEDLEKDEMKKDIWLRLEEELDNLEEEQKELETTEMLLIEEEEKVRKEEESHEEEDEIEIKEIKEEIKERKKQSEQRKKVLQKFQHIFDKDDLQEDCAQVGTIHEKIENFLKVPDQEGKRRFEDNALVGVSDIMSRVKCKFETPVAEYALYKPEVKRRLNPAALVFETMSETPDVPLETPKPEKEWSWKNKSAVELELENMPKRISPEAKKEKRERKKGIQDLKFDELLNDINSVKERMKERDINRENETKMEEMNKFMDEIKDSLRKIEDEEADQEVIVQQPKKLKKKTSKGKPSEKVIEKKELIQNIKNELLQGLDKSQQIPIRLDKDEYNISLDSIKRKIVYKDVDEEHAKPSKPTKRMNSGIVSKLTEMLAPEESNQIGELSKAPKVLLRNTSLENDDLTPKKTLEELKIEQQNKKWAWKEKDMKDLQEYINSYDDIVPTTLKDQQKNLKDLEDELDIVESLIDNKETDIIVQIRSEKEKEFNNFMDGVKSYLNEDTKTSEEDDFKQGMLTYLDLIDNNKTSIKSYKVPQLKTNTLDRLKTQLFNGETKNHENKSNLSVSKLPSSIIEAVTNSKSNETIKQVSLDVKSNQTSLVKSFFETNKEAPSPVLKSKGIHPAVLNLKKSNSDTGRKNLLNQLHYKHKTINEVQQYIESHDDLCVPTLIETIQKFSITKKEEDKLAIYSKFIELAHQFVDQKGRSGEQKIFKDNIDSYLKVIEDVDIKVNGTPKLKKHASIGFQPSSNNKKKQLEKTSVERILSSEEKRKNILQKYGFKDHITVSNISDESEESDDDDDVKDLTDNELCLKYGLPPIAFPDECEKREKKVSVAGFKGLLSKIRKVSSGKVEEKIESVLISRKDEPKEGIPKSGSTSKMKNIFENRKSESNYNSPMSERKNIDSNAFKKGFNDKLKRQFETGTPSPDLPRKFEKNCLQKSSTISNIGSMFEKDEFDSDCSGKESPLLKEKRFLPMEKSRSFSKFKNAFETGVGINEDTDCDITADYEKRKVNAELDELKSSKKLQKMFRINRSLSDAEKSPRLDRELDDETLKDISRSRSAITDMFESRTPKVTFGGTRPKLEKEIPKPKVAKQQQSGEERKWVFDTIQKYFDVIVEEEHEEEEEDEEQELEDIILSDHDASDDDNESDYTSAEEDLPEPVSTPGKAAVKNKIDVSSFFKEKPSTTHVLPKSLLKNSPLVVQRSLADKPMSPLVVPRNSSVLPQSPLAVQRSPHGTIALPKRKISIDDFVNDAAKQFDELTDGSSTSINLTGRGESCQNLNQLSKSNSSSKIRGLFSSVVHGSASDLNISTFKSNLLRHLSSSKPNLRPSSMNLDPGVLDDSSSEYSEYDD